MVLEDITTSPASYGGSQLDSSTDRCTSPETSSSDMSVSSSPYSDAVKSPRDCKDQPAKKARTSYTREQTLALMKVFQINPYPDYEMLENIGKELGIPENKLKIWFQNRRARTRRKDNISTLYQAQMGSSHITPPMLPYGYLSTTNMSSLPPVTPGYCNSYPWMQSATSPNYQIPNNNNNNSFQMLTSFNHPRLQTISHTVPNHNHVISGSYHIGYSHPRNAYHPQHSPDNAVCSLTSNMDNESLVMSQKTKNIASQSRNMTSYQCQGLSALPPTSSLLTTPLKDARPPLSILPATISQSSPYSFPYRSFSANQNNTIDQRLC